MMPLGSWALALWDIARRKAGGRHSSPPDHWRPSRLHGPEAGLVWTTITALGAAKKVLNGAAKAGYQTPASAFGKDFVLEGEGVTREDVA
jgi:hypothetical protein